MFYAFRQNNSGGGFDYEPVTGIAVNVIIEATSAEDANERAEVIGLYFDGYGDCECCGNRWHEVDESEGTWGPTILGKDALTTGDGETVVVHFMDGTKQWASDTTGYRWN